ncbi:hypothetical protein F66182_11033 [Fusarium sp. NRRL 66182]|nr:hypothetical protein F66182_11033 [Fusarium sp. NRRL 66182]
MMDESDDYATSSRRGTRVSREKHQGTSFVNTTVTTNIKTSKGSRMFVSGIRFKAQKPLKPHTTPKPVTEEDLKAAQAGNKANKRIAPKTEHSRHKQICQDTSIPYQSVADTTTNASFSFELNKAWTQANVVQNRTLPSPEGMIIPDWALHGLPVNISDEGRRCFHAYLFSCPIRQYPLEQLQIASWQPFSSDQSRFERLVLHPLTLRCTLSMGALFLLLKSGKRESAGFAMHSARLCSLVNRLLAQEKHCLDDRIILIQSVASLAILSSYLGLYDHWYVHVKGLKHLVDTAVGLESLPAPVQLLVAKASLKGACELAVMPLIAPISIWKPISNALPCSQRTSLAAAVRWAVYRGESNDAVCDGMQSLSIFVATINFASSQHGKIVFDPLALMEEFHSIEYKLVAFPEPVRPFTEALKECFHSHLNSIRLTALVYLKFVKGGSAETLHGPVHLLRLLCEHLKRISSLPRCANADTIYGYTKGSLIWVCLVADLMSRTSEYERWNLTLKGAKSHVCRDFMRWVLGNSDGVCYDIKDEDIALCLLLDFWNFGMGVRMQDPRAHIKRILAG